MNVVSGTVVSDTQLTAVVPSGATTGKIVVTTSSGSVTSATNFTVDTTNPPPKITSFSPASGPVGMTVTITGTNFISLTSVTFNGVEANGSYNATTVTATVPSGATTGKNQINGAYGRGHVRHQLLGGQREHGTRHHQRRFGPWHDGRGVQLPDHGHGQPDELRCPGAAGRAGHQREHGFDLRRAEGGGHVSVDGPTRTTAPAKDRRGWP